MPISQYWAKKKLEQDTGTAVTSPSMYLALLTTLPEAATKSTQEFAGSMKEAEYAAYVRISASGAFWNAITQGATNSTTSKELAKFAGLAASETCKVKAIALFDGSTLKAGNLLYWAANEFELTELITPAEAAAGALSLSLK
jgi:hypothetical protein